MYIVGFIPVKNHLFVKCVGRNFTRRDTSMNMVLPKDSNKSSEWLYV